MKIFPLVVKMNQTSKTGLLSSPIKKFTRLEKRPPLNLSAITGPAPFILKPFAGLYNPFSVRCSLLCNHPADTEARKMLRKAKDNWANDCKTLLLPEEVAAIRAELSMHHKDTRLIRRESIPVESVPEEMFRRYTETDSRPLTPAPTLASAQTRASATRRCVTPDPIPTSEVREKTLLILDLRKSHSQETLSWYGSASQPGETPLIRVMHVGTRAPSPDLNYDPNKRKSPRYLHPPTTGRRPKSSPVSKSDAKSTKQYLEAPQENEDAAEDKSNDDDEDVEIVKRRGKRRRRRGRDSSRGPPAFQTSIDPETQVSAIGPDSQNPSGRPSLVPSSCQAIHEFSSTNRNFTEDVNSYLNFDILRQLRRELNEEIIESEFNIKRRLALEEAMKTVSKDRTDSDELAKLKTNLNLPYVDTELWLTLPRMFHRSSARFELPMDRRMLSDMTPLEYLKDNVYVNTTRKLLYNYVFNRNKVIYPEEINQEGVIIKSQKDREILGKQIIKALGEMMGHILTEIQATYYAELVGWSEDDSYEFKTFCGVCALCERIFAKEFYPSFPSKKLDPCQELEIADFESLERRLKGQNVDKRLEKILFLIKSS